MEEKVVVEEKAQMMQNTETTGTQSSVSETVATLKGIPTKEDLKNLLEQNVLTVDFTKLNGDKRVMTCTLRGDMKPPATKTDTMSQKKVREVSNEVVSVWDVNAKGWRSFRYERVNAVDIVNEYEQNWYFLVDKSPE
jgi:hypothetical protein